VFLFSAIIQHRRHVCLTREEVTAMSYRRVGFKLLTKDTQHP